MHNVCVTIFITVQVFTSFALSIESGLFVSVMYYVARFAPRNNGALAAIPLALGENTGRWLAAFVTMSFATTAVWDMYDAGVDYVGVYPTLSLFAFGGVVLTAVKARQRWGGGVAPHSSSTTEAATAVDHQVDVEDGAHTG